MNIPVGFDLLDDEFTIPDLQRLYEAILGVKFDRRNFQRKIISSGILEATSENEETRTTEISESEANRSLQFEEPLINNESIPSGTVDSEESISYRKVRKGRPGILFRLNKAKYDELKEDGLKQEF